MLPFASVILVASVIPSTPQAPASDAVQGIILLESIVNEKCLDNSIFKGVSTPFELRLYCGGDTYNHKRPERIIELRAKSGIKQFYSLDITSKKLTPITFQFNECNDFFISFLNKQFYFICSVSSGFVVVS